MHIVIVSNRAWNRRLAAEVQGRLNADVTYLEHHEDVSKEKLTSLMRTSAVSSFT